MNRITEKDLEAVIKRLNHITGSPEETYVKDENGKYKAQIGNYHLDCAYGGYALHRICNDGAGSEDIFYGHYTKRDLYHRMQAFIKGYDSCKAL